MKRRMVLATAVGAVVAMGAAACGGGGAGGTGGSSSGATPQANAAIGKVYNPSDKKGGTLKVANSGDWDSLDPGDTYYAWSWNFIRLYVRPLVTFKVGPGKESLDVTGDLAEGLGEASPDKKTWTYKLRKGVKFEDGTEVKAKDVQYAVARSYDRVTFPNGPEYLKDLLVWPDGYQGPFKSKGVDVSSAVSTPDDYTVVFHLKEPIGDFDQFAQLPQTAPVPEAKDTGEKFKEHVVSTGPYMFEKNELGKSFALVRNPSWDPATDPNRKALPDRIEVAINVNADDMDSRLISGDLDIDVTGNGVQVSTLPKVLGDPTQKARTDNAPIPRLWYTSISSQVAPLDNVHCRRAVLYATDKVAYQKAEGGEIAGGDVATTVIPPLVPGYEQTDAYPTGADHTGDLAKAKDELAQCGQPNGFETGVAFRQERPKEKATAEALQQALGRVGIKLNPQGYPQGDYFKQFAGRPPFVREHKLGLSVNSWQADWNDSFAFLSQMTDSRVIKETGGSSNISVRSPDVDAMLDKLKGESDKAAREKIAADIDKKIMDEAFIIPGVYGKTLILRGSKLRNVFINEQYGAYDFTALGVQ